MTATVLRLLLLAAVGGSAWLVVGWWQRRTGRNHLGLPVGLTLVTGPGCAICGPVERALRRAGAAPVVIDVTTAVLPGPPIRSLPVAIVVDTAGDVVMRRAGRSALDDAGMLAARALGL